MTTMIDSIRSLTDPVGDLGGRWMLHPEVLDVAGDAGYANGYLLYAAGRGGVLGDVAPDVVAAAFGFFNPSIIAAMWPPAIAVEGPRAAAERYGALCAQFGRTRLAGFAAAARLAELAGRVAAGVDPAGLSLFAGWRSQPLPDDAEGRAFFLLHVLRELRGSVHIAAVVASGLSPRDAVLATVGPDAARQFGWSEPFPELAADAKVDAEALTDRILARLYGQVLDEQEAAELAVLVLAARVHIDAA